MSADGEWPLLDPRLRFPIHALPNERVVWSGTAAAPAYRAALLSVFLMALGIFLFLSVPLIAVSMLGEHACVIEVNEDNRPPRHRDCTEAELARRQQRQERFHVQFAGSAVTVPMLAVALQALANALRRRHLVYVVSNERVVVQDGHLAIRLDTIDLDHVVSITARASLIERWFGVKSVSVTVPGQKTAVWQRGVMLANAIELWGLPARDPALSQLLNAWLPRTRS